MMNIILMNIINIPILLHDRAQVVTLLNSQHYNIVPFQQQFLAELITLFFLNLFFFFDQEKRNYINKRMDAKIASYN